MTALTETQIERHVERAFDSLDNRLMNGWLTQTAYDAEAKDISDWADRAYVNLRASKTDYPFIDLRCPVRR